MCEVQAPELRDSDLPMELAQHLFDIQMGRRDLQLYSPSMNNHSAQLAITKSTHPGFSRM